MAARDEILAIPDDLLRSGRVTESVAVFMDFLDNPIRWWAGLGDLDVGGYTWQGTADLITFSPPRTGYSASADAITFSLAATDEMVALTADAEDTVYDRDCIIWGQLFYTQTDRSEPSWQPVGPMFAHFVGTMQGVSYDMQGLDDNRIDLTAEGVFMRRSAPPRGLITDIDQKARHPGDRGAEYVAKYVDHTTRWI